MVSLPLIVERCCSNQTLNLDDKFALLAVLEDASRDESELAAAFDAMTVFVLSQPHLIGPAELMDDSLQSLIEMRLIEAIQLGPTAPEPSAAVRFALLLPGESMAKFLTRRDAPRAIADCLEIGKYPLNVQTAMGVVRALHTCWNLSTPFISSCGHETGVDAARTWQQVVDWAEVAIESIMRLCLKSSTIEEAVGGLAALYGLLVSHDACNAGHENEVRLLIGKSPKKRENGWNSVWKGQELSDIALFAALPEVQDILERQMQMAGNGQACAVDVCTMLSLAVLSIAVNDRGTIVGCPALLRRRSPDDTSPSPDGISAVQFSTEVAVSSVIDWVFEGLLGLSLESRYEEEASAAAMAAFDFARTFLLAEKKATLVRKAAETIMKVLPPPPAVIDGPQLDLLASLILAMPWMLSDDDPMLHKIFGKVCHYMSQVSNTQVRMRFLTDISLRALAHCDDTYHTGYSPASLSILEGEWMTRIVNGVLKVETIFEEVIAALLITCRGLIASYAASMCSVGENIEQEENNPRKQWLELGTTLLEMSACCVAWPSTLHWFPLRAYAGLMNLVLSVIFTSTSSSPFETLRHRLVNLVRYVLVRKFPNPNTLDSTSGHLPLLQVLCMYVPVLMGVVSFPMEEDLPNFPGIVLDLLSRFSKGLHGGDTTRSTTSVATLATCLLKLGIECENIAMDAEDLLWHEADQFICKGLQPEAYHMMLAASALQSIRNVSTQPAEDRRIGSNSVGNRAISGVALSGNALAMNGSTISLNDAAFLESLEGGRTLLKELFGGTFTPLLHTDWFSMGHSSTVNGHVNGERNEYFPCMENAILDRLHAQIKKKSCHRHEKFAAETEMDFNTKTETCEEEVIDRDESPHRAIELELASAKGGLSDWVALNGGSDPLHIMACHNSPKMDPNWEGSNGIVGLHLRVYNATAFKLTRTVCLRLSFGPGVKPRGCSSTASLTISHPLMPGEFVCWDVCLDISPLDEFVGIGEVIVSVVAEFPGMELDEELEADNAAELLHLDEILTHDEEDEFFEGGGGDENGGIVGSSGHHRTDTRDVEQYASGKIMCFSFLDYHVPIVRLLGTPPSDALSLSNFQGIFSSSVGSSVHIPAVTACWILPFANHVEKIRRAMQGVNTSAPPASCAIRIPDALLAPSQDFVLFCAWLLLTHCGHIVTAQLTAIKEPMSCVTPKEQPKELGCQWCGRLELRCTSEASLLALTGADSSSETVMKFLTNGVFDVDCRQARRFKGRRSGPGTVFDGIEISPWPSKPEQDPVS